MNVNSPGTNFDTRIELFFLEIKHPPGLKNPVGVLLSSLTTSPPSVLELTRSRCGYNPSMCIAFCERRGYLRCLYLDDGRIVEQTISAQDAKEGQSSDNDSAG